MRIIKFIRYWIDAYKRKFLPIFKGKNFKDTIIFFYEMMTHQTKVLTGKIKNLRRTNYELGLLHYNKGNLSDAIFRFKLLKYFFSDIAVADFYIGRCYIGQNRLVKASPFIEKYLQSGDIELLTEARYCQDLINMNSQNVKFIPLSFIQHTFDLLAFEYDSIFINKADIPQDKLCETIGSYVNEIATPFGNRVLDIGCGTGYVGKMLKSRNIASLIHGVDISLKMIEICKQLKINNIPCYDSLFHENAESFLKKTSDLKFNIIIMSKIFNYILNIEDLIALTRDLLTEKGCLAISFKTTDKENASFNGYFEEFHHNAEFVQEVFKKMGFVIHSIANVKFPDSDLGINMLLIKG